MNKKQLIEELKQAGATQPEADNLGDFVKALKQPLLVRSRSFKLKKLRELKTKPEKKYFFNWKRLFAPLTLGFASLTMAAGAVFASQGSMPGEPLYGVKRWSEKVFQTINPSFAARATQRRSEEIKQLVFKKSSEDLVKKSVKDFKETPVGTQTSKESQDNLQEAEAKATGNSKEEIHSLIIPKNTQSQGNSEDKSSEGKGKQNRSSQSANHH